MDLLQQWRNIYQEAIHLAEEVEGLPDECPCGDADAHLEGRCLCCERHERKSGPHAHHENCVAVLARMRADLAMLCEDFMGIAGPMKAVALDAQKLELRRDIFLTANDLQQIAQALERMGEAFVGFRQSCALTEMRSVKRSSAELREHCHQLNIALGEK